MLAVDPKYFTDNRYISQKEFLEMWRTATRNENITSVDIRIVKPKSQCVDENGEPLTAIYATKNEVDWDAMKEQKRVPFCFVTPGGDWVECAEMGWFGMTSNDKDPKEWDEEFWNYVDSLHDEIPVTVVDFHI